MGEGLIHFTGGYGFKENVHPPFDTFKFALVLIERSWKFTGSKIILSFLALNQYWDHVICSTL